MSDIEAQVLDDLRRSGISDASAFACCLSVTENAAEIDASLRAAPALVIPYHSAKGAPMLRDDGRPFLRVRYYDSGGPAGFVQKKPLRYSQPQGSGVRAYFPGNVDWSGVLSDASEELLITEGEKKAIAAAQAGFRCIGLGGVFNWLTAGSLLPELEEISWRDRAVFIVFDSDASTNNNVRAAELRLFAELSTKRGADVRIVRLPAKDGVFQNGKKLPPSKVGLDDFLVAEGVSALGDLLDKTPTSSGVDAAVLKMNEHVAWVRSESAIYDIATKRKISKADFTSGDFHSVAKMQVTPSRSNPSGVVQVAREWLTHANALRYEDVIFEPGSDADVVLTHDGACMNLWRGYDAEAGDVEPFLELTKHVFANVPAKDRDFALKLMAFKAQNPAVKVGICPVLIGTQGSGKSLWSECLQDAFAPYSSAIKAEMLGSQFNSWIERSLLCVINEAKGIHVGKSYPVLRSLITDVRQSLNDKFRPVRDINSYTMYIMTSNERSVGSFAFDDRRMFVVDVPPKREDEFYFRSRDWRRAGGGKQLMGWLLDYDLRGWEPPFAAPMTAEKTNAYQEGLTAAQKLADTMRTAGQNTVKMWLDAAMARALSEETSPTTYVASAARDRVRALGSIQIRPWYTPEEIAILFPFLANDMQGFGGGKHVPSGEISRQLRDAGIKYLENTDSTAGFMWGGMLRQYLVVAEIDRFGGPVSQAQFEEAMVAWPRYGALLAGGK